MTVLSSSFAANASSSLRSISSSYALTASYAISASYEINYETSSSYAENATSASYATIAQSVLGTITNANTASNITPAITNTANNRVLTDNGGGTINGESNLTFDGTILRVTGSLAQGMTGNTSSGTGAHAEGQNTSATQTAAHAEGNGTTASGNSSHAEGNGAQAIGATSHAEGNGTQAIGNSSHAEGLQTYAVGDYSHAEGQLTVSKGVLAHAEGWFTSASGDVSHTEGYYTSASGLFSHAEGSGSRAFGNGSHAEGDLTLASGLFSHAEGSYTTASGYGSHAEGEQTKALNFGSHAEGLSSIAKGDYSHAEGYETFAGGESSHAAGYFTSASGHYQSVIGMANQPSTNIGAFIIGNGPGDVSSRSNLLYASGSIVEITGSLYVSRSDNPTLSAIFTTPGTKTSPAYTFIGDTATGMFRQTTNTVALSGAGNIRLMISDTELRLAPGTTTAQSNILMASNDTIPLISSTPLASISVGTATSASYATIASSSLFATTAGTSTNVAVTDTTSGTGPYYLMFADGTSGNRTPRVDSSTLTFNATTDTLTVANLTGTASIAANSAQLGGLGATAFVLNSQTSSMTVLSSSFAANASSSLRALIANSATSATSATSASYATVASSSLFATNASIASTATTAYQTAATVTGTNSTDLVYGSMADNDQFRIRIGGTATNAGFVELATADDGTEPIYVRQYTGVFTTLARTATLLDGSGNTTFPGSVTANSFSGPLTGTASYATSASQAISSSFAINASSSLRALIANSATSATSATSASYATVASSSLFASHASSSLRATNANSATVAGRTTQNNTGGSGNFYIMMNDTAVGGDGRSYNTSNLGIPLYYDAASQYLYGKLWVGDVTGGLTGNVSGNASTATSASFATLAASASRVTVTTSAAATDFIIPFINSTSNTAGTYSFLQDGASNATYNPASNTLSAPIVYAQDHIFGYSMYNQNGTGIYDDGGDVAIGDYENNNPGTSVTMWASGNNVMSVNYQSAYISHSLGISTTSPQTKLHVEDVTKTLTGNVAGVAQGTLSLVSTDAQAADKGASLVFGGNYINSNSTKIAFAGITGRKSNSSTSNADGYLSFLTWRSTGLTEAMRITAAGSMGLGIAAPTATTGRFEASNDIVAFSTSDKRWKNNIVKIDSPLEKISQISGVEFDWIEDEPLHGNKGHDVGVIAQEIELVLPEAVQTRESGMKAVQYDKIIPLLIESIKEQQKQIDELKELVNKLTK
jgi:hypothetical protein